MEAARDPEEKLPVARAVPLGQVSPSRLQQPLLRDAEGLPIQRAWK